MIVDPRRASPRGGQVGWGVMVVLMVLVLGRATAAMAGPWQPLFNGTNLDGWEVVGGTAPYAIVDGAIVGTTVAGTPNTFLRTTADYGDFVLEFDVRQDVGPTNSGVQFRSQSTPDFQQGRVHGYQCEIDPSPRAWTGGIYDEARRGWLYPGALNPTARDVYQYRRWNRFRIEAIGSSLRTWVNGVPVAHVIDYLTPRGFIALQVHSIEAPEQAGRRIAWRNLRIQTTDLQPAPLDDLPIRNLMPNTVAPAEEAQGWRLLWDGHSAEGWRGAHQDSFPARGWTMKDGELVVQESGGGEARHGGDIVTRETFGAFELQLEFQLTAGANSGIKYFVTEQHDAGGGSAIGLEYQLLDDASHPDATQGAGGNRTLASLYDLIPRDRMPGGLAIVPKVGAWQHARIVSGADGHVEHWLNGIKVVTYQRGSPLFAALVARSKYEKFDGFGLAPAGHILLQDHGNEVRFRSIKIRNLP